MTQASLLTAAERLPRLVRSMAASFELRSSNIDCHANGNLLERADRAGGAR